MAKNPLVSEVHEKWEQGSKAVAKERRDFWMNFAFYHDEQWTWWDPQRNRVESLDDNIADYRSLARRVRTVMNRFKPNINTLMGKWLQNPLRFDVVPDTTDDATLLGGRLAQWVLEAAHRDGAWEDVREEELFNTLVGGTAGVALHINDDVNLDVSHNRRITGANEVMLKAMDLREFCIEPGSRNQYEARWWMQSLAIPPEQVRAHYGMSETPTATLPSGASAVQRRLLRLQGVETNVDLTAVYILYERPNEITPAGRVVHVVGGEVVAQTDWPFPFEDRLNLYAFRAMKSKGFWFGDTFVSSARQPQVNANFAQSVLLETLKMTANTRAFYPVGYMQDPANLTDQPGEWVPFHPTGTGDKAHWMEPPQIPRWVTQYTDTQFSAIDDIMHVHDISRGVAPGDRNSGLALSILAEKDETPLSVMARDQQKGWSEIASMYLKIIEDRSPKADRVARVQVEGVPLEIPWTGEHLAGQTNAQADMESVSPHSRAARQQMIVRLQETFPEMLQGMDKARLLRLMEVPGLEKTAAMIDPDAAKAIRENQMISIGQIMMPAAYDNHPKHMAEHRAFKLTTTYEMLPETIKEIFELHEQAHDTLLREEVEAQQQINAASPGLAGTPRSNAPIGALEAPTQAQRDAGAEPIL